MTPRSTSPDSPDAHPLTLAIEVSNPSADAPPSDEPGADVIGPSVAIARGPLILDQEALHTHHARHDDDLMPAIDRLVRRAGLNPRDIQRVAVSIGPGGFTGLRVSIATAKALGEVTIARGGPRENAVAVPTAIVAGNALHHSHAWPRWPDGSPGVVAVALASKRESAFVTILSGASDTLASGAILDADHLRRANVRHPIALLLADRFLPDPMRQAAEELGIPVRPPMLSAAACARAALAIAPVDPALLLPLYPREPEAVTKWRALHPRAS